MEAATGAMVSVVTDSTGATGSTATPDFMVTTDSLAAALSWSALHSGGTRGGITLILRRPSIRPPTTIHRAIAHPSATCRHRAQWSRSHPRHPPRRRRPTWCSSGPAGMSCGAMASRHVHVGLDPESPNGTATGRATASEHTAGRRTHLGRTICSAHEPTLSLGR